MFGLRESLKERGIINSSVKLMWEELRVQTQIIAGTRSIILQMQGKQLALLRNITQQESLMYGRYPTEKCCHLLIDTEPLSRKRQISWLNFLTKARTFVKSQECLSYPH